jgi:hypothetical protein
MSVERPADFEASLAALDTELFAHVKSQTSIPDRLSLLALHNACRQVYGSFSYLEIGSHLGGSLQVFLADERCTSITSIDSRPLKQPDVRGVFDYPGNSTERMLDRLKAVPGADFAKLHTIDATTAEVSVDQLPARPQLCLIDGEHTIEAAIRDARFCRQAVHDDGAIAFHDRPLVKPALEQFLDELGHVPHEGYPLPGRVFVVEIGDTRLMPIANELLADFDGPRPPFLMEHPARRWPPDDGT